MAVRANLIGVPEDHGHPFDVTHRTECSRITPVEAIPIHRFVPCRHEVCDEFRLCIRAAVDVGQVSQLRVRTEHEIDARPASFQHYIGFFTSIGFEQRSHVAVL